MLLISILISLRALVTAAVLPDLPPEHLPLYLYSRCNIEQQAGDGRRQYLEECGDGRDWDRCWGYEVSCSADQRFMRSYCPDDSANWAKTKADQEKQFFTEADFGYVRQIRSELTTYCGPQSQESPRGSELQCSKFTKFCRGRHIFIDLRRLGRFTEPMRYKEGVLADGEIGGFGCTLQKQQLLKEGGHKSPLQSWFDQMEHFTSLRSQDEFTCDIWIDKPTFLMKLDATVNMYHHFCDFINLYLTMHVNGSFQFDNQILVWDMHSYRSNFGVTWQAFTDNDIMHLEPLKGKRSPASTANI